MKKIIASLVMAAGLAMSLMGGAQAQTISGSNGVFAVDMALAVYSPPDFTYAYTATLDSISAGGSVNSFDFNFQEPVQFKSVTGGGFTTTSAVNSTAQLFTFTSSTGLTTSGQSATFTFFSPDPPNGTVGVAATAPGSGGGTTARGPLPCDCPAVPEPASLALLGLGALPLGLIARRRMASRN